MDGTTHDIAIIGSGFAGIAMAARLKDEGRDFVILERARDVGGTWRDNAYPGCACDVPSHLYSFSFAPNADWTSTFSAQPEIHAYIRRTAEERGILPHVRFGHEVEHAAWDAAAQRWRIRASGGLVSARALISAAGPLSEPRIPDIPGLREFPGRVFHSASWDHGHDLTGERVAVVGTGASAIQFVPQIQPAVGRLHLFQRTPPWVLPRPARRLTRLERRVYRRFPAAQRAMRAAIYWGRELYAIPLLRAGLARATKLLGLRHLRRQVPDRRLRRLLTPDYIPGCKRILISDDYLPSLTRPNVEVLPTGVTEVRGSRVVGADGSEREVDTIIFGTGFHVTDVPIAARIHDGHGRSLAEHWSDGLSAHRGTTVAGFPNLFLLLGPNTGLGHTSVVLMAEWQAGYVAQALAALDHGGAIAPRPEAQEAWNRLVQERMEGTVWTEGGCASWYVDANGRNTTLWPDHTFRFRRAVRRFDPAEYEPVPAREPAEVAA